MAEALRFDSLVEQYHGEIFGYLMQMVRNEAEAQDLCQETYLRAYRAFHRLDGPANYRAWLYKIATNTALNHIRRRSTSQRVDQDMARLGSTTSRDDHASRIDNEVLLGRVQYAIEHLPEKQRLALTQRKFAGLSYAEIAQSLGTSEESARANVYQAVRKLREQFAGELSEVGI